MNTDNHPAIIFPDTLFADEPNIFLFIILIMAGSLLAFILARKTVLFLSLYKFRIEHLDNRVLKQSAYRLTREPIFILMLNKGLVKEQYITNLNAIKYKQDTVVSVEEFNSMIRSLSIASLGRIL